MKNILTFVGILLGIVLCLLEGIINHSDTASIDNDFGIEIISWKFFILKLILYSILGGISGFLCSIIINYFIKRKY